MPKPLDPEIAKKIRKLMPDLTAEEEKDVCWLLERGDKSQWLMKHKWVERMGHEAGVTIIGIEWLCADPESGHAACQVTATVGTPAFASVITTGEASPKNQKTAYPFAMAEKRGVDRAILKLVGLHGDVYSDADDFNDLEPKKPQTGDLFSAPPAEVKKKKGFTPPTLAEVVAYAKEKRIPNMAQDFIDFYASKGWKVGNQPMKSWQHAYNRWCKQSANKAQQISAKPPISRVEDGITYRRS